MLFSHVNQETQKVDVDRVTLPSDWRRTTRILARGAPTDPGDTVDLAKAKEADWFPAEITTLDFDRLIEKRTTSKEVQADKVVYTDTVTLLSAEEKALMDRHVSVGKILALETALALLIEDMAANADETNLTPQSKATLATIRANKDAV